MNAKSNKNIFIDISIPLKPGMHHWPGDPVFKFKRNKDMDKGDVANVSLLEMGSHTGTHIDAPIHFFKDGKSLDKMPLDATLGPVRIIEIQDKIAIKPDELKKHDIKKNERIIFKTINSTKAWGSKEFHKDFVYISVEGAKYLAELRVRTVGVDYLSVGGFYENGVLIHQTLLGAGIWLIEGLDLSKVEAGEYELLCLPLKVLNSDGAPARAVLMSQHNFT